MCITTGGIGQWQRMRMWRSGAPLLLLLLPLLLGCRHQSDDVLYAPLSHCPYLCIYVRVCVCACVCGYVP